MFSRPRKRFSDVVLITLILLLIFYLSPVVASCNIEVISDSSAQTLRKDVEIDAEGNVHITWSEGGSGNYDIMHRMWNISSKSWGSVEKVYDSGTIAQSVSTDLDEEGNLHVVFMEGAVGPNQLIKYTRWLKSSGQWSTAVEKSPASAGDSEHASIAVDGRQNIVIVWGETADILGSGTDRDILAYYNVYDESLEEGTYTTQLVSSESTSSSARPIVDVDKTGNIHVVWEDSTDYDNVGTDTDVFYKLYSVITKTWSSTEVITNGSSSNCVEPALVVDDSENVHIVWHEGSSYGDSGSDDDVFYRMYDKSSKSWRNAEVVSSTSTGDSRYTSLATGPYRNIHVVWDDRSNIGGEDRDILYRMKDTKGNWGDVELISVNCNGSSGTPRINSGSSGNIHIVWGDESDYNGAGLDRDIFYCMLDSPAGADFEIWANIIPLTIMIALIRRKK